MEIIGYIISLIISYGLIYSILKFSDFVVDKLPNMKPKDSSEVVASDKPRITLDTVKLPLKRFKVRVKKNNTSLLAFTIKNLIRNDAHHNDVNKLLKLINSKTFSPSSFNEVLNNNSISDLNYLKHKIKQNIEKNKPLYENKLVTLISTVIITEFFKRIINISPEDKKNLILEKTRNYFPNFDLLIFIFIFLFVVGSILFTLYRKTKNKKKIISLDQKYIISEIDRVIELKSNLENEIH